MTDLLDIFTMKKILYFFFVFIGFDGRLSYFAPYNTPWASEKWILIEFLGNFFLSSVYSIIHIWERAIAPLSLLFQWNC